MALNALHICEKLRSVCVESLHKSVMPPMSSISIIRQSEIRCIRNSCTHSTHANIILDCFLIRAAANAKSTNKKKHHQNRPRRRLVVFISRQIVFSSLVCARDCSWWTMFIACSGGDDDGCTLIWTTMGWRQCARHRRAPGPNAEHKAMEYHYIIIILRWIGIFIHN